MFQNMEQWHIWVCFGVSVSQEDLQVEMHHQRVDFANPGDNVGLNIKGLDKSTGKWVL